MSSGMLEKGRMVLVQFGEDLVHDGLTEKDRFRMDLEAIAVLVHGLHFLVVEIEDIAVLAEERRFLFLEIGGVHARDLAFSGHRLQR